MFVLNSLPENNLYCLSYAETEEGEVTEMEITKELHDHIQSNDCHDVKIENGEVIVFIDENLVKEKGKAVQIQKLIRLDHILDELSPKMDKYRKMDDSPVKTALLSELGGQAETYRTEAMQTIGILMQKYGQTSTDIATIIGGTIGNQTI